MRHSPKPEPGARSTWLPGRPGIQSFHVCPIYDVGEHEGSPYVVMAYVEGQSLEERLRGQRRFEDAAEAVTLARQVAEALEAVHAHGIIHRDLKLGNILIDAAGRAVLTDFGLARPEKDTEHLTVDGAIVGTPAFMAPEQASGDAGQIGPATDLYSLGVVLFRMLTGKMPFEGQTLVLLNKIMHEPAPTPSSVRPGLAPALDAICSKAMAKRPGDRYQSAGQIAAALDQFLRPPQPAVEVPPQVVGWDESASPTKPPASPSGVMPADSRGSLLVGLEDSSHPTKLPLRWITAAAAALVLGVGSYLAPQVIRIVTNKGTIVIETDAPGIEVVIKDGLGMVSDPITKREITFKAGTYNIEVTVTDSGGEQRFVTDQFTLTRNGKHIVKARWEMAKAKPTAETADPDRRAAEWVLSIGGILDIRVKGQDVKVEQAAQLPQEPFRITVITLHGNDRVTDAGLSNLKGLADVTVIYMAGRHVTDAGIEHFKGFTQLGALHLQGHRGITDAGLAHLGGLRQLYLLDLENTAIVGDGLHHLKGLTKLRGLNLMGTHVTAAAVNDLQKALPNCKISWGDPDRRAAEYALSIGGTIRINGQGQDIRAPAELPKEPFRLSGVNFYANKQVTDAGLAHFKDCKNLTNLNLERTQVTDADLAHFKDWKNLWELYLNGTRVTDAGLAHLKDCKNLTWLQLSDTRVTDAGLAHLKDCTNLKYLGLVATQVTDAGLAHLKDCKNLTGLQLNGTQITDAGLAHLKDLTNLWELELRGTQVTDLSLVGARLADAGMRPLESLTDLEQIDLRQTKVTQEGIARLQKALPKCQITWDGNIDPDRRAAE